MQSKKVLFIVLQLVIIGGFIYHFNIEVAFNLPLLYPLIVGAFIAHTIAPASYRRWIFIIATCVGLCLILPLLEALLLLVIGLGMIGICNLPLSLVFRKLILLAVGMGMAWLRFDNTLPWVTSPMLTILGSIFMFRMLLFVHELKYQTEPTPFLAQISYFFMLPNVVFPLFPVVDYKLFQRQYFDGQTLDIYQRGVYLMARGVLCLFFYRIIYTYFLPSESEVDSLFPFLSYISLSYMLTLRLAGIFHFSVGVLHLFGHRLPDVFNYHFLASSFSDLWRRINIYWKDFIVKLYFNPLYFKLKKRGARQAIFLTTLVSFALTLFFHQYQTFWITGVLTLRVNDVVFWGFFGITIALGTLDSNPFLKTSKNFINAQLKVAKVLLTFITMSTLWSFWVSNDLKGWLNIIQNLEIQTIDALIASGAIILIILTGGYLLNQKERFNAHKSIRAVQLYPRHAMLGLLVITTLIFNRITLERFWNNRLQGDDIHALFNFMLKDEDAQNEIAGYYDQILTSSDLMSPKTNNNNLWSKTFQINLYQKGIVFKTDDAFKRKIAVSRTETFQNIRLSTNSHGMYDKEYSIEPPDSTYRIAFMGASIEMGWAIPYGEGLEKVIENRLNETLVKKTGIQNIEILNFSVPSRNLLNHNYALRKEVRAFNPDMVVIFDHDETDWLNLVDDLYTYDYSDDFDGVVDSAYRKIDESKARLIKKKIEEMEPFREQLILELLQKTKAVLDSMGSQGVYVEMPEINSLKWENKYGHFRLAKRAGFKSINLSTLFNKTEVTELAMDVIGHPNLEGNKRLTDALFDILNPMLSEEINR